MAADVESSYPRVTFPTGCLSHQDTGIFQYSSPPANRLAGTRPSWTASTGWSWLVLVWSWCQHASMCLGWRTRLLLLPAQCRLPFSDKNTSVFLWVSTSCHWRACEPSQAHWIFSRKLDSQWSSSTAVASEIPSPKCFWPLLQFWEIFHTLFIYACLFGIVLNSVPGAWDQKPWCFLVQHFAFPKTMSSEI